MRIRPTHRSVASQFVLSALVFVLGFAGLAEGAVLWLGGDGHVAIEAAGPDGCVEAAAPGASLVGLSVSSSHCGPCFDVALSSSSPTEGVQAVKRNDSAAAAIAIAEPRSRVPHLRPSVSYRHFSPHPSEQAYSVVIRC